MLTPAPFFGNGSLIHLSFAYLTIISLFWHPKAMKKLVIPVSGGIVLAFSLYVVFQLLMPLPVGDKNVETKIPKGATFRQVAEIFSHEHIIRDENLFLAIGRLSHIDRKIRAGFYSVNGSMNLLDLLQALRKGQIIEYEVTVIEGDSLREVAANLSEKGITQEEYFWKLASDKTILASYGIDAPSLEGYLYPDTYKIPKGMDAKEALGMMINKLREHYGERLRTRAEELGLSEREVLTLASIIEKEAATDAERPLISAVYHNRLRKNIPLQADPTAIYGVKSSKEKITSQDLKRKTPYNTYSIKGLPPGPISSAGIKSITAALYPAEVHYLFFVSNNDGTHRFSVTAAEHAAAVRAYREKRQAADTEEKKEIQKGEKEHHDAS